MPVLIQSSMLRGRVCDWGDDVDERERYEKWEEIGRTPASVVYRARDRSDGQPVALKRYTGATACSPSEEGEWERCFLGPPSAVQRLEHPAIGRFLRCGHDGKGFIVVSELVKGERLSQVARRERLTYSDRLDVCLSLADGLARAHEEGIVHLALKPGNVLIDADGRARILDFVRLRPDRRDEASTPVPVAEIAFYGTPEQVRGRETSARTDVFAFGIDGQSMGQSLRGHQGLQPGVGRRAWGRAPWVRCGRAGGFAGAHAHPGLCRGHRRPRTGAGPGSAGPRKGRVGCAVHVGCPVRCDSWTAEPAFRVADRARHAPPLGGCADRSGHAEFVFPVVRVNQGVPYTTHPAQ